MYRKNVAGQYLYFGLINASTGAALTGATVTGKRAIDGAAQASVTGTVSEEAGGQYKIALSQADVNGNNIGYLFTATSAIPVNISIVTTAGDPTDAVRFGLSALPNANAEAAGGLYTRGSGAGQIAQQANGQIDANLSTVKTQAVTCAAPVTVLASVGTAATSTAQTGDSFARIGFAGANLTNITPLDSSGVTTLVGTRIPGVIQPQTGDSFARLGAPAGASVSADVAAVNTKTTNLPASPAATGDAMTLTAGERNSIATAHLDLAAGVETGLTVRQGHRLTAAAAAGKLDGAATTTVHLRDQADTKNRVTATVDANGNRSAITLDLT